MQPWDDWSIHSVKGEVCSAGPKDISPCEPRSSERPSKACRSNAKENHLSYQCSSPSRCLSGANISGMFRLYDNDRLQLSAQASRGCHIGIIRRGMDVIIYHNPACGTSRNTLGLIRNAGVEPHIIEYLKTPPSRAMLKSLIERMGVPVRSILREKGTPYAELGLSDLSLSDDALIDAMMEHPILINRPIVVSPKGVKLCRPSEAVLDLLPPQQGEFRKEDGRLVVDAKGDLISE